tara:strand:- start:2090 stop:3136 length:1047 start_codon:yes stop_codon:yes gene_type:complete
MIGKFLGKLVILLISYLLICAIIYFVSFFSLTKKKFIDLPGFRAVQKSLYYGPYLEVWQNKSECVDYDEKLIYVPKIGSCKHSNAEFQTVLNFNKKGRINPNAPDKSKKSIIVLGDSHAMGWGVKDNETFSHVLQNLSKTPVYNLAVSSYGTIREVMMLEKSNLSKNSDIIIIQYHENDLRENLNFNKLDKNEYEEIFLKMTSSKIPVNIFDAKFLNDGTFATIKYVARKYKSSIRLIFTDIIGISKTKIKKQNFNKHYSVLMENIKKINNFNEKKIIIFYSSSPEFKFYNFPNGYDANYPNVYFHDIFVDDFNQDNYFYLDKHPNHIGHKKIGESLYKVLKQNLLIN